MRKSILAQALIAIAAAATMAGATAQTKPTPVGEANDHTLAIPHSPSPPEEPAMHSRCASFPQTPSLPFPFTRLNSTR